VDNNNIGTNRCYKYYVNNYVIIDKDFTNLLNMTFFLLMY